MIVLSQNHNCFLYPVSVIWDESEAEQFPISPKDPVVFAASVFRLAEQYGLVFVSLIDFPGLFFLFFFQRTGVHIYLHLYSEHV